MLKGKKSPAKLDVNLLFLKACSAILYLSYLILLPLPLAKAKVLTLEERFESMNWSGMRLEEVEQQIQLFEFRQRERDFINLLEAKNYLINGQAKRAQFYLEKWKPKSHLIDLVRLRYLAITYFIQDKYKEMDVILSMREFSSVSAYPQICLLKSMAALANIAPASSKKSTDVNANSRQQALLKLKDEVFTCGPMTLRFSDNEQIWLDNLYRFAIGDRASLRGSDLDIIGKNIETNNLIRIWLKLGLFTNRERYIAPFIENLPYQVFQSPKSRELLGLIYYRMGNDEKAFQYIEDLNGPNAENIKGNLEMVKGQHELAFGHFKLALLKKENSKNAIERALPLAWILGQYKDGLNLLSRVIDSETDVRKKMLLNTVFQTRLNNYVRADQQMKTLKGLFYGELPKEASIVGQYVSLINEKESDAEDHASIACRKNDGLACWFLHQTLYWDDFSKTMKRDEETYTDKEITVENLKVNPGESKGMSETLLIDQKDIEELDGIEVKLLGLR